MRKILNLPHVDTIKRINLMLQSKSNAFTMIELIFVIVLLGILASVAMTKLNATRTDAEISVLAQNVLQTIEDIKLHAVATGSLDDNITVYSTVIGSMLKNGTAHIDSTGSQLTIDTGRENDCVKLQLISNLRELNLTVTMGTNSNHDPVCSGLQEALGSQNHVMQIRGQLAKY